MLVILDIAFVVGCLAMPRGGVEVRGTLFVLALFATLHLIAGIAFAGIWRRRRRWVFYIFFFLATVLMTAAAYRFGPVASIDRQTLTVLSSEARHWGQHLAMFQKYTILAARRVINRLRDSGHVDLCMALDYPVDPEALSRILAKKPDIEASCVLLGGRRAAVLPALLGESYERWRHESVANRQTNLANIQKAVDLLLSHGADPNARDENASTALHWAIRYEDDKLVSLLLDSGSCVYLEDIDGASPLNQASHPSIRNLIRIASQNPQMASNCPELFAHSSRRKVSIEIMDGKLRSPTGELFTGARNGEIEPITRALSDGADVNIRDEKGRTPLHYATRCRAETPAIIELLVTAGADVNARDNQGETPLMRAVRNHCPQALAILLDKGADPTITDDSGTTALHAMIDWSPDSETPPESASLEAAADDSIGLLTTHGADPNATDPRGNALLHLMAASSGKTVDPVGIMHLIDDGADLERRNSENMTPLMIAVKHREPQIVKALLDAGADPNVRDARGVPLLHTLIACQPEVLALMDMLIAAGADVNIRDDGGQTAMHRALLNHVYVNCMDPLEHLLRAGANPNVRDRNGMPALAGLDRWQKKDPQKALRLLKSHGADVNIRDHQGLTLLMRAARFGTNPEVMQILIDAGADPRTVDLRGNTLLHCAAMNTLPGAPERLRIALSVTQNLAARNQAGLTALDLARKYRNDIMEEGLLALGAT